VKLRCLNIATFQVSKDILLCQLQYKLLRDAPNFHFKYFFHPVSPVKHFHRALYKLKIFGSYNRQFSLEVSSVVIW